jgi:ribosome-binding factor A
MRNKTRGFARSERINDQIQRDLSEILSSEVKDPRIGMITLTGVEVTADYAHAKVYFTTLAATQDIEIVKQGLKKSSPFIRSQLFRRLHIHTIPELHFEYDISVERGMSLSTLIDQANALPSAEAAELALREAAERAEAAASKKKAASNAVGVKKSAAKKVVAKKSVAKKAVDKNAAVKKSKAKKI